MNVDTSISPTTRYIIIGRGDSWGVFDRLEASVVADGFRTQREAQNFIDQEL
jgi:hypothetical protein